jgi:hypothetical protein
VQRQRNRGTHFATAEHDGDRAIRLFAVHWRNGMPLQTFQAGARLRVDRASIS